ncbi:MAG TPA: hydrogen gas-evolving membrane-bound hydrogenase subunit E [Bacteroidota bacterium]|nr:hydrogen gas-evolving membrane-bound hydrogenase subunit E [Bacteroidota bacterium]
MKKAGLIALILFWSLLIYASLGLPRRGDPGAPAHRALSASGSVVASTYYIQNAEREADTPNIVTAILGDYRSYDTLGEVVVVLTAGLCCALILRRREP